MDCIFCKIVNKEIPATIVFEDDTIMAFKDINPVAPIHLLIIPKKHIDSLATISEEEKSLVAEIIWRTHLLAKEFGISESGFRVQTNSGYEGGQVVGHMHWHLLGGKKL